jgi:hypothetical protein
LPMQLILRSKLLQVMWLQAIFSNRKARYKFYTGLLS